MITGIIPIKASGLLFMGTFISITIMVMIVNYAVAESFEPSFTH
jgi:hypothetical protein